MQAPVLTFLNAYSEVTAGWLPPLLARIAENRHTAVSPAVDHIDPLNFQMKNNADNEKIGVFDANLQPYW